MTKLTATAEMRARIILRDRLAQSSEDSIATPLTCEEAVTLAIGAIESCWSHFGFHRLMNLALQRNDLELWGRIADLLEQVPLERRAPGVLRFFADWTPIDRDASWANQCYRRRMDALRQMALPAKQAIAA